MNASSVLQVISPSATALMLRITLITMAVIRPYASSSIHTNAQGSPTLSEVLSTAGNYVSSYEAEFSSVVSEEHYVQRLRSSRSGAILESREIRSDVLLATAEGTGWIWFRDAFAVDGRPVRDREARLLDLFLKPRPDSHTQATRITEESARFNIGPLRRTINVPTLALVFLKSENQRRCRFSLERMVRLDGAITAEVSFVEDGIDRLVATEDNAPSQGRVWIEPSNGRVLKTEFQIKTTGSTSIVRTIYGPDKKSEQWLPLSMSEEYLIALGTVSSTDIPRTAANADFSGRAPSQYLEGLAKYSHFRRFSVSVSKTVK